MSNEQKSSGPAAELSVYNPMRCLILGLLVLFAAAAHVRADDTEERYLQIHALVQQGDSFITMGNTNKAMLRYKQAQTALLNFQRMHPDWDPKMVNYRLSQLAEKLSPAAPKPRPGAAAGAPQPAVQAEADTTPARAAVADKTIKLLEAGAEPRQALRLHPKAGDQGSVTMTMALGVDMQMGQMPGLNMKLPGMKLTLDSKVAEVRPNGDIKYDMVVTDAAITESPEALPQVVEAMKNSFGSMKRITASGLMSAQGVSKEFQMKLPSGSDVQTKQALEQMRETFSRLSSPMPAEPIGAGAKWEVKTPIKSQGMTIQQTATYELVSIEGDRLTLKNTIAQSAAKQKVANPAMPNLKLDLTEMKGEGKGESVADLSRILPSEAVMDLHSEMQMAMNAGGQNQAMILKTDVNARLEGK
jgi:Family of unknown function (DUF6263)